MNSEKVEAIFAKLHPQTGSGYWYPRRECAPNWSHNLYAISWGCARAERLASRGCEKWAYTFWCWAVGCYKWRAEGSPTRAEYEKHLPGDQRIEVRLLQAAHCLWTWNCDRPFTDLIRVRVGENGWGIALKSEGPAMPWAIALEDAQISLIWDSFARGTDPEKVLWPAPVKNKQFFKLVSAAEKISKYEHQTRKQ